MAQKAGGEGEEGAKRRAYNITFLLSLCTQQDQQHSLNRQALLQTNGVIPRVVSVGAGDCSGVNAYPRSWPVLSGQFRFYRPSFLFCWFSFV